MFCPVCGNLLIAKEEKGKRKYVCPMGHKVNMENVNQEITVYNSSKQKKAIEAIVIEEEYRALPKTTTICPKCGNTEAYWILRQTRSADEGETRYFICTKCKAVWREY